MTPIPVGFPDEYEQTLLDAKVIADVEERRQKIRKALDKVTRASRATGCAGARTMRWWIS